MRKFWLLLPLIACLATHILAQDDVKAAVLKHLKTSRDFTLKIADQMPASSYDFKLTSPQMSFAQQLVHLFAGIRLLSGRVFWGKAESGEAEIDE
jgi:hypothetical protein